jgi:hypothetical protein
MCRAQFDKDDIAEAEIVCGRRETDMQGDEIPTDNGALMGGSYIQTKRQQSSRFTLKLPAWVNFPHSTLPHKPLCPQRKSNPSGTQSQKNFSRLHSLSQSIQLDKLDSGMHATFGLHHEPSWGGTSMKQDPTTDSLTGSTEMPCLVVPHSPPIPWDDQTTVDLPYDNPFYTRTYADVLWLPRNPCGILNLDDTIDLKVSLTTDVPAGQLGTWLDIPETNSPPEVPQGRDFKLLGSQSLAATSLPPVDGTEDILLPPVIARRVRSKEDDVEQALRPKRPSAYRRQISGRDNIRFNMGPADSDTPIQSRSSIGVGDLPLPLPFRSFSDGNDYGKGRPRSSSMSALNYSTHIHPDRSTNQRNQEPGSHPVRHAQAELPTTKRTSSGISFTSRTQNVSARIAIAQEVVAEEEAALVDRTEDEQAKAHKATATKSWLTSWMFKKSE